MSIESLRMIGLLGGMSSAATGEYYRLINQKVKEIRGGHHIAELMICSVNFGNIEQFVRSNNWIEAGQYLAHKATCVEQAGASCLFLGSNTMHRVRDQIKEAISIPFIDIFETVSAEIRKQGKTKIGMLGTYPVMSDDFYVNAFREFGVELIAPEEQEKREVDRIIFDEMTHHRFLPSSKAYYLDTISGLVDKGAEGIILGCTEIKMLIGPRDIQEVPLFDTTTLHCDMAAGICTGEIEISRNTP
ncbi:MAG: amino acid racemase [Cytophagales bacterium]|nr:amino acid racemase [Cytophagales bacterium]